MTFPCSCSPHVLLETSDLLSGLWQRRGMDGWCHGDDSRRNERAICRRVVLVNLPALPCPKTLSIPLLLSPPARNQPTHLNAAPSRSPRTPLGTRVSLQKELLYPTLTVCLRYSVHENNAQFTQNDPDILAQTNFRKIGISYLLRSGARRPRAAKFEKSEQEISGGKCLCEWRIAAGKPLPK